MMKHMNSRIHKHQHGVVLFVALISLLIMSLAAVALIRSVDTNTLIAGNLAFKQSAKYSADHAVETALKWISANQTILESDHGDSGYFAALTTAASPGNDQSKLFQDAAWEEDVSANAVGEGITDGVEESSGNTIKYVIQRMCTNTGKPETTGGQQCLYGAGEGGGNQKNANSYQLPLEAEDLTSPIYRVTVRVKGPRNTTSYTQAFIF